MSNLLDNTCCAFDSNNAFVYPILTPRTFGTQKAIEYADATCV